MSWPYGDIDCVRLTEQAEIAENGNRASKPALLADMTNQAPPESASKPEGAAGSSSDEESFTTVKAPEGEASSKSTTPKAVQPLVVQAPYPASVFGLEAGRVHCRFMMNRIVTEV